MYGPGGNADADDEERPLRGFVLCGTSITLARIVSLDSNTCSHRFSLLVQAEIQRKAEEMGARFSLDLTSEVTHLLCAEIYTPKYRYVARYRPDVTIVDPDWVDDIHKHWIKGHPINIAKGDFLPQHRVPVFYNLIISITGFTDREFLGLNKLMNGMVDYI